MSYRGTGAFCPIRSRRLRRNSSATPNGHVLKRLLEAPFVVPADRFAIQTLELAFGHTSSIGSGMMLIQEPAMQPVPLWRSPRTDPRESARVDLTATGQSQQDQGKQGASHRHDHRQKDTCPLRPAPSLGTGVTVHISRPTVPFDAIDGTVALVIGSTTRHSDAKPDPHVHSHRSLMSWQA
jgi:hypothetical protein